MRKLLSAGFLRLRKAMVFWLVLLFMLGLGLFLVVLEYLDIVRYHEYNNFDQGLFAYITFIGICCAVFCSSFLGTEYSDNTFRNKIMVGHKRRDIYFTNLIVSLAASFLMFAAFLLAYCPLGTLVSNPSEIPMGAILSYLAISLFTIAAITSVFNMLAMLIPYKSVSSVVCVLFFFLLLAAALVIRARLDAPEYVVNYFLSVDGVDMSEPEPNPRYLQGMAREIYQFFFDLLPSGQAIQIASREVEHPLRVILCSVGIVIVTNISGARAFCRKDLR